MATAHKESTGTRVLGRFILASWLVISLVFAWTGWRERNALNEPLVHISELRNQIGQRVRVQGTIAESFSLPGGERMAIQAIIVSQVPARTSNTTSQVPKHVYTAVWPDAIALTDGAAEVPVQIARVRPHYMTPLVQTKMISGFAEPEAAPQIAPQLLRNVRGTAEVFGIRPGEPVIVIGTVEQRDVPAVRSDNQTLGTRRGSPHHQWNCDASVGDAGHGKRDQQTECGGRARSPANRSRSAAG